MSYGSETLFTRTFHSAGLATPNILWTSGLIFGLAVRVAALLHSNTLEIDESALLINILERDWGQLWAPLGYNQQAPIGYLLCVKLATLVGGNSYLTLRTCNLLIGCLTILILALCIRKWFPLSVAALVTWILAISHESIFYSVVAKQYAFDLGLTSILLVFCVPRLLAQDVPTRKFPVMLAMLGSIFVWLSHPIVFVLIGYLSAAAFRAFGKSSNGWRNVIALSGMWFSSFALNFFLVLHQSESNQFLKDFWNFYFAPFPPSSFVALKWYLDRFFDLFFIGPFSFTVSGAIMILFVCLGITRLFYLNKPLLVFLVAPILCALGASIFMLYPFYNRFLLFSVPLLLLLFSYGFEIVLQLPRHKVSCVTLVYLLLLLFPVLSSVKILLYGLPDSYPKNKVIASFEKYVRNNDVVFASYGIINRLRIYYYLRHDMTRANSFADVPAAVSLKPDAGRETWLLLENRKEDFASQLKIIIKYYRLEEVAKFNGERTIGLYRLIPDT